MNEFLPAIDVVKEVIKENIGRKLELKDLEKWKVPSGGGLSFQSSYDSEAKEIECIIMDKQKMKVMYEIDDTENHVPVCQSEDATVGEGVPGGECKFCIYNKFIDGKAKACKDRYMVIFLKKGDLIPSCISIPAMSIKPFEEFLIKLTLKGKLYKDQIVKMTLKKEKNKKNDTYSVMQFEHIESITGHREVLEVLRLA